jgi:hypothetical protein
MELPNAYGPNVFRIDGIEHTMERHAGMFKLWKNKDGDRTFHMVDFSDGCYRAGMPVSLETLKAMRDEIDRYIVEAEKQ